MLHRTLTELSTMSKKVINDPAAVVDEALEGAVLSNNNVQLLEGHRVVIRREIQYVRERGLVALISGGGSGHEPAHGGFVRTLFSVLLVAKANLHDTIIIYDSHSDV